MTKFLTSIKKKTNKSSLEAKDEVWQAVGVMTNKIFVYSAFYDSRGIQRMVRIIGISRIISRLRIWCLLWYNSPNNTTKFVRGKIEVLNETEYFTFSACFILCPLKDNISVPHSISVFKGTIANVLNRLLVHNGDNDLTTQPTSPSNKLAVCVLPVHSNYGKFLQILEFMEMNILQGVNHFTFYNTSIGSTPDCILSNYVKEGQVTVRPWTRRIEKKLEKHDGIPRLFHLSKNIFEPIAAINDCIYRNMYKFSYVAVIDLDEIIMPKYNDTIIEFIEWINARNNNTSIGAYSFQNAIYYLELFDDPTLSEDPFENKINLIRKIKRKTELFPHGFRSKYVCRPEYIIAAGNSIIRKFVPGYGMLNVTSDDALVNHYRECEFKSSKDCKNFSTVIDRTTHRFKTRLINRIKAKWSELKMDCSFPLFVEDVEIYYNY